MSPHPRFDNLLFPAVVTIGAATIAFPLSQYRSFAVDLTYLAVFLGGGLTVVVLEAIAVAVLARRYGKELTRDRVALSKAHRSFHGSNV